MAAGAARHEIADLLSFIETPGIRNTVWLTADMHYTGAPPLRSEPRGVSGLRAILGIVSGRFMPDMGSGDWTIRSSEGDVSKLQGGSDMLPSWLACASGPRLDIDDHRVLMSTSLSSTSWTYRPVDIDTPRLRQNRVRDFRLVRVQPF